MDAGGQRKRDGVKKVEGDAKKRNHRRKGVFRADFDHDDFTTVMTIAHDL